MRYQPKTATQVEIYFGTQYRLNILDAFRLIGPIVNSCCIPMGPNIEGHASDILYGQFFDGDPRAHELAKKINAIDGLCAKVVDVKVK